MLEFFTVHKIGMSLLAFGMALYLAIFSEDV